MLIRVDTFHDLVTMVYLHHARDRLKGVASGQDAKTSHVVINAAMIGTAFYHRKHIRQKRKVTITQLYRVQLGVIVFLHACV